MNKLFLIILLPLLFSCGNISSNSSLNISNISNNASKKSIFFEEGKSYSKSTYSRYVVNGPGKIIEHNVYYDEKVQQICESLDHLSYEEITFNEYMTYGGTCESFTFSNDQETIKIDIPNSRYTNGKTYYKFDERISLPEKDDTCYQFFMMIAQHNSYYKDGKLLFERDDFFKDFCFIESDFTFEEPTYVIDSATFGIINCYDDKHFTLGEEKIYYELIKDAAFNFIADNLK